jgi:uncharacterized protein (TIRG00374 family)
LFAEANTEFQSQMTESVKGADAEKSGPRRPVLGLAIGWAIGASALAGMVIFAFHVSDFGVFLAALRTADPLWLAMAILCQAGTYFCAAAIWFRLLSRTGSQIKMSSLMRLALVELFANQALPTGGLSGSIIVMRSLHHRGVEMATVLTALLVTAFSYYTGYVLVGAMAFVMLWRLGQFSSAWTAMSVAFGIVVVALAAVASAVIRSRGRFIPAIALKWKPVARLSNLLSQIRTDILFDGRIVAEASLLQCAIFLLDAASLGCAARSVGMAVLPEQAFVSFMLASIVATLSPIPMGLGTFEGVSVGMLHFFGGSVEKSLAATLILRAITLWAPMLPGLWMIRREAKRGFSR